MRASLAAEVPPLVRLALPLIAGHAGNQLMGVVDTLMVGRLGKASLGGVGLGNAMFFTLTILAMGCVFGMEAPVAQALGAGEHARARRLYWQGLRVALYAGVPTLVIIGLTPLGLPFVGVDAGVAAEASRYLWARLPQLLPLLVFVTCRSYLQALELTRPIVISTIVANVANVIGNGLLIFGDGALAWLGLPGIGLPALGVVGAAIATVICQGLQLFILATAVRDVEVPADPGRRRADPAAVRLIFRLGVPLGLQMLAEIGVFSLANLLAATLSADASAGHQLAITCASFTFMFALGTGAAASVRVGQAVGRGDTPAARRAGLTALVVILAIMAVPALAFLLAPHAIARAFTDDATVVAAAAPLLMIAAVFQLSDGVQAVAAGALRGAGDRKIPLVANVVGHWGVGLPISIALGFTAGLGAPGLWWGLSAGLTAVAVWLSWRFARLSGREIARV